MNNIIYFDDYINLYNESINEIFLIKPYKETIDKGTIKDIDKLKKVLYKKLKDKKLNNKIIGENITIIYNFLLTKVIKMELTNILEELNYKNITYINELDLIKLNKNRLLINFNLNYFYVYYINEFGKTLYKLYDNDEIEINHLIELIKHLNKKDIIVVGNNYKILDRILDKHNINYYNYEYSSNIFIRLLINS